MVIDHCEPRGAKNVTNQGKIFQSKNKIPHTTRLWLRRKILASKKLKTVKTVRSCRGLKEVIKLAEDTLSKSYFQRKFQKENKAIDLMSKNPLMAFAKICIMYIYFYKYIAVRASHSASPNHFCLHMYVAICRLFLCLLRGRGSFKLYLW